MNWVDLVVIAVLGISALLAFMRGFVREVLGLGAWVGAALFALWAFPFVRDRFRVWLEGPDLGDPAAFAAAFLLALIVLSIISGLIGGIVRTSVLGGLDRTLGVLFGLVRGVALLAFAYIAAGWVVPIDRWPEPVLQARSLPYAHAAAVWAVGLLPPGVRPGVVQAPPPGREARAEDFLRATPQGRAIARP
ncbi:MAG: CvpA family protein [Alphaproteobacteria bacterium]|nr:CvpA family protein [Alphaproteobacteria bacterium]